MTILPNGFTLEGRLANCGEDPWVVKRMIAALEKRSGQTRHPSQIGLLVEICLGEVVAGLHEQLATMITQMTDRGPFIRALEKGDGA